VGWVATRNNVVLSYVINDKPVSKKEVSLFC
jgi:hypothetical protein